MKQANLPLPELGMIAGTRAMLGAGLGLLLADKFPQTTRKRLGWTLFLVGALSTIPLGFDVLRRVQHGDHPAA
jgi:hypothetical protein